MIKYKIFTLPNGIDVLFLKRPEQYSVYVDILINAGSLYETEKNSGVSHFFEHLLFDGTADYPTEHSLREYHQEIGFHAGASTNVSNVHVQASFPRSQIMPSLRILKDMVYESLMIDAAIQKERGVILDEQRQRRDNKHVQLWEFMLERIFGGTSLSLSPGGTITSVSAMLPDTIRTFYKTHVNSRNTSIIIGGNFTFREIEEKLEASFLNIREGAKIPMPPFDNAVAQRGAVASLEREGNQEYLIFTYPSYAGIDLMESAKNGLLRTLLSEQLHRKLRIDAGLVYHIGVDSFKPARDVALTMISGSCNAQEVPVVFSTINEVLATVKKEGFPEGMLNRIRTTENNTLPMRFDVLSGAMSWCSGSFHTFRKVYLPDELVTAANTVTENDLRSEARKIFSTDEVSLVTLGPMPEAVVSKALKDSLRVLE